jgi:hypothetical protein
MRIMTGSMLLLFDSLIDPGFSFCHFFSVLIHDERGLRALLN